MYRPPDSDSEDDYDGFYFGDTVREDHEPTRFIIDNDQAIEGLIEEGDLNKIIQEIEGRNLNLDTPLKSGSVILGSACRAGHFEVVKYLIDQKANPNKTLDSVSILMEACACTKQDYQVTKIVKLLLDHGAVVNVSDKYGTTPFMLACKNGHTDVVRLLVKDVSFDACDNQGCTPIFHAIENNRADIVRILVESGANATIANKKGYTPRQVAQFHGFYDILEHLPREKMQPYQVPTTFLVYNNICDMIPRIFLKSECPEYFQDINLILLNMGMESVLEYFAKERVSLSQFLTMNDTRLEEIGIKHPIHRLKLLKGLLNFHLNQWTKKSIARVRKEPPDNFYHILVLSANHLQNLVIVTSTLKYVKDHLIAQSFGNVSKEIINGLRENTKSYRTAINDLKKTTKYLQSFSPERPPLYIDYDDYLVARRKTKIRKFFKYTVFITLSVVICLKVKRVF